MKGFNWVFCVGAKATDGFGIRTVPGQCRPDFLSGPRLIVVVLLLSFSWNALAAESGSQGEQDKITETVESMRFWRNLVPVPIFITEPAVGEGFGLAIGYFHPEREPNAATERPLVIDSDSTRDAIDDHEAPPKITGVAAGYTNNGTTFAGLGHSNSFRNDQVRFNVLGVVSDLVAEVYVLDVPFEFNLQGGLFYSDTRVRIGNSNFFWGVGVSILDAENTFGIQPPEDTVIGQLAFDILDAGISGRLMYDSRDDTLFPASGQRVDLTVDIHDDELLGDYDYNISKIKALSYHTLTAKLVLGGRLEAQHVSGKPPFFAVPYVSMRGIPSLRYQGDSVAMGELEMRYRFAERWTALAFGGIGWREKKEFESDESIYNFGLGGRFKLLRERNVWMGIDIARGPEDTYWYIQVGQAW